MHASVCMHCCPLSSNRECTCICEYVCALLQDDVLHELGTVDTVPGPAPRRRRHPAGKPSQGIRSSRINDSVEMCVYAAVGYTTANLRHHSPRLAPSLSKRAVVMRDNPRLNCINCGDASLIIDQHCHVQDLRNVGVGLP
jgi:hypothetical protein